MSAPEIPSAVRIFSAPRDRAQENLLQRELGIPAVVAAVLVRRGYGDPAEAEKFLNPRMEDLGDPRLLPDYAIAEEEILGARDRGEKIFIHGDYDADGVTSAALFTRFLEAIKCNVQVHVPHRMKEGYGIHLSAVEKAKEAGAKLFLTCDCGISAHEQVAAAREAGMRVVVTDHHSVGASLPDAQAVVNPHRSDSEYPYRELCGAGVVFRLCEGLARNLDPGSVPSFHKNYLDLATVGTVADVMPLTGENRIIVKHGLKALACTKRKGLIELKRIAELLDKEVLKAGHIGFQIGPRLNATGRIDDAVRSLNLLMTRDETEAKKLAEEIDTINTERQAQQREMVDQAVAQVMEMDLDDRFAIVVGNPAWHAGIVGLVASRLVETFRRPAFAYTIDSAGRMKGSARSIPGFHLADAIRAHPEIMDGGGHAMAAGFSAQYDMADQVAAALNAYAGSMLSAEDFQPIIEVDAEVDSKELTFREVEALGALEPFGNGNPGPIFCTRGCVIFEMTPTRNGAQKVRLNASAGPALTGFYSIAEPPTWYTPKMQADVIFAPELNEWQGLTTVQWKIKHIEPSAVCEG